MPLSIFLAELAGQGVHPGTVDHEDTILAGLTSLISDFLRDCATVSLTEDTPFQLKFSWTDNDFDSFISIIHFYCGNCFTKHQSQKQIPTTSTLEIIVPQ